MRSLYHTILEYLKVNHILANQDKIIRQQSEILNALTFNSTIADSEWLKYKSFSPGKWAVDYGFLYTLYRVLNDTHPHSILEFGLGQSSRMLHQYGSYWKCDVVTCEHNQNWISFFLKEIAGRYKVNFQLLDLEKITYKGYETLTYKNINNIVRDKKFDLILVDGPFGSEHFSRSQIIELSNNNLDKSFCIIMDDYERSGEKETAEEIEYVLKEKSIDYCKRVYCSSKEHILICSSNLEFLTTL